MTISTSTMTLVFTAGTIYPDTYSMDVVYTLYTSTSTASGYSVTQYVSVPYTTSTQSVVVNGVTTSVSVVTFLTGTSLTAYLNSVAPIESLVKTALAAQQFEYLADYVGTGTVVF